VDRQPTKIATSLASGSAAEATSRIIADLRDRLHDRAPALICVFASTQQPLAECMAYVGEAFPRAKVIGSSTSGEFTEDGDAKHAVAAFAICADMDVHAGLGRNLRESPERAVADALASAPPRSIQRPYRVALLLLDPLSGQGAEATLFAAEALSREGPVPLAGGAAGDDLAMRATQVGCGREIAADALVLAVLDMRDPVGLGVFHGHEPISPPLRVTRAVGNIVFEVEGRPAWEVWAEHTREAAARAGLDPDRLRDEDVGAFLLRYEAGLSSGATYTIRAPLARGADGSLTFAASIPEGALVRITESDPPRQIASASIAARHAREQLRHRSIAGALVFDCICRNLILGESFRNAIAEIARELDGAPLAGFETYGEVALDAGDMSGFHNTTTVVLAFPE
jgi:methyl-accepting chemotaxis protein